LPISLTPQAAQGAQAINAGYDETSGKSSLQCHFRP
jgi:hypothetical protein